MIISEFVIFYPRLYHELIQYGNNLFNSILGDITALCRLISKRVLPQGEEEGINNRK